MKLFLLDCNFVIINEEAAPIDISPGIYFVTYDSAFTDWYDIRQGYLGFYMTGSLKNIGNFLNININSPLLRLIL